MGIYIYSSVVFQLCLAGCLFICFTFSINKIMMKLTSPAKSIGLGSRLIITCAVMISTAVLFMIVLTVGRTIISDAEDETTAAPYSDDPRWPFQPKDAGQGRDTYSHDGWRGYKKQPPTSRPITYFAKPVLQPAPASIKSTSTSSKSTLTKNSPKLDGYLDSIFKLVKVFTREEPAKPYINIGNFSVQKLNFLNFNSSIKA